MTTAIVKYINEQIRSIALADARFSDAALHPVVFLQQRVNAQQVDQVPAYFLEGKMVDVVPQDTHPVILWHRIVPGVTYKESSTSMGNNLDFVRTIPVSMLVIANLERIKIAPEDLEVLIVEALPATLPKPMLGNIKAKIVNIRHQASTFTTPELYQREFRSPVNKLKPHHAMFEVRYQIEVTYQKGCLTVQCFCNN